MVYRHRTGSGKGRPLTQDGERWPPQKPPWRSKPTVRRPGRSTHAGALAALAFDDVVALFHQALTLAVLALLLLLDVGTFFIGHDVLPAKHFAGITMIQPRISVYKQTNTRQNRRRNYGRRPIAATPRPANPPTGQLVRDATARKIDDIKGASDGAPWSIRNMLP
jgi:hypothetical protein